VAGVFAVWGSSKGLIPITFEHGRVLVSLEELALPTIGVLHKRNSRGTSVSLSLLAMQESEAKRCFMRSLRYWSRKTPESHMSL
jgi:hypothetical protein